MLLLLQSQTLKLVDPQDQTLLHAQPVASIRVWGVGRDSGRWGRRAKGCSGSPGNAGGMQGSLWGAQGWYREGVCTQSCTPGAGICPELRCGVGP